MEKLSIKKAIQKGQLVVNLPVTAIILGFMFFGMFLISINPIIGSVVFVAGFPLAWLYWSVAIVRWKLWAYENVDDVVGLKRAAVRSYLIWSDDSIFNKTEIKSKKQSEQEETLLKSSNAQFVQTKSPLADWEIYVFVLVAAFVSVFVRGLL